MKSYSYALCQVDLAWIATALLLSRLIAGTWELTRVGVPLKDASGASTQTTRRILGVSILTVQEMAKAALPVALFK